MHEALEQRRRNQGREPPQCHTMAWSTDGGNTSTLGTQITPFRVWQVFVTSSTKQISPQNAGKSRGIARRLPYGLSCLGLGPVGQPKEINCGCLISTSRFYRSTRSAWPSPVTTACFWMIEFGGICVLVSLFLISPNIIFSLSFLRLFLDYTI